MAEKVSKSKGKGSNKDGDAKGDDDTQYIDGYKVPGKHMYHMGDLRFIHITKFKFLVLVALKEFVKPPQWKTLKPGKAAISLTAKQFHIMTGKFKDEIDDAIKELEKTADGPSPKKQKTGKDSAKASATDDKKMQLSDNRRVSVRMGEIDDEKQVVMEVREYTMEKGKEKAPTEKGIILSVSQWNGLKSQIASVDKDLEDNFGAIRKDE